MQNDDDDPWTLWTLECSGPRTPAKHRPHPRRNHPPSSVPPSANPSLISPSIISKTSPLTPRNPPNPPKCQPTPSAPPSPNSPPTTPPPATQIPPLLQTAKSQLLHLSALLPSPTLSPSLHALARLTLETGALLSIRLHDTDAFTRYVHHLTPFYELPPSSFDPQGEGQRGKVTGLWLLLLLTRGDYGGFHCVLEGLDERLVGGKFVGYAVGLERWLMEGAYDRVWRASGGEGVPGEEEGVFSEVLIGTIRAEIASCSEKAYPSLPMASAKNLLFLKSEGDVVEFARGRGWVVRDGRVYFPLQQGENVRTEKEILVASGQVIENTIGYARELETIV